MTEKTSDTIRLILVDHPGTPDDPEADDKPFVEIWCRPEPIDRKVVIDELRKNRYTTGHENVEDVDGFVLVNDDPMEYPDLLKRLGFINITENALTLDCIMEYSRYTTYIKGIGML